MSHVGGHKLRVKASVRGRRVATSAPRMKLGIVKEIRPEERRVAASPQVVARWVKAGWDVQLERGAGEIASYPDTQYEAAGAALVDRATAWGADVVLKLRPPLDQEVGQLREGTGPTRCTHVFKIPPPPSSTRGALRRGV